MTSRSQTRSAKEKSGNNKTTSVRAVPKPEGPRKPIRNIDDLNHGIPSGGSEDHSHGGPLGRPPGGDPDQSHGRSGRGSNTNQGPTRGGKQSDSHPRKGMPHTTKKTIRRQTDAKKKTEHRSMAKVKKTARGQASTDEIRGITESPGNKGNTNSTKNHAATSGGTSAGGGAPVDQGHGNPPG